MYCANCGYQNPDGARFCGNCGATLQQVQAQPTYQAAPAAPAMTYAPSPSPKAKVSPRWASIGASVAIICFFMPWLMVSCSGSSIQASALQLATGNYGSGGSDTSAYPGLFLFLIIGFLGLICLNGKRSGAIAALGAGIAGVIGLVVFIAGVNSEINQMTIYGLKVDYMVGYFGEWLAFISMIGIGVLALQNQTQQLRAPYPAQPGNWGQPQPPVYPTPQFYGYQAQPPSYPAVHQGVPYNSTPAPIPQDLGTPPSQSATETTDTGQAQ